MAFIRSLQSLGNTFTCRFLSGFSCFFFLSATRYDESSSLWIDLFEERTFSSKFQKFFCDVLKKPDWTFQCWFIHCLFIIYRTLEYLFRNKWLDGYTRTVFVEFTVYNANVNLFCIVTLLLETAAVGKVKTLPSSWVGVQEDTIISAG